MCSSGREEPCRACSGDRLPVGRFGPRRLHGGGVVQGDFRLDLGRSGDALTTQGIFRTGTFFLTLVADVRPARGSRDEVSEVDVIVGGCLRCVSCRTSTR